MTHRCQFERVSSGKVRCSECRQTLKTAVAPELIRATCRAKRRLTLVGQALAVMPAGDALAAMTKYTGIAAAVKAITDDKCGCADRQAWLNRKAEQIIWRYFSIKEAT